MTSPLTHSLYSKCTKHNRSPKGTLFFRNMQNYLFHPLSSPPFSAPPELILLRRLLRLEKSDISPCFLFQHPGFVITDRQTRKHLSSLCFFSYSQIRSCQKAKDLLRRIIRMKYALLTSSESNPLIGLWNLCCREAPWLFGRVSCKSPEGRPWSWDSVHKLASLRVGAMPRRAWNSSPRHSCSICHLDKGRSWQKLKHYSWNFPIKRKMLELQTSGLTWSNMLYLWLQYFFQPSVICAH